jgi:hypothetical protein
LFSTQFARGDLIRSFQRIAVLEKYWFSVLLFAFALISVGSSYVGLAAAFLFTFLVPGLAISRFFRLKFYEFVAFVPVLSTLVFTQFTYFAALAFGYSRELIVYSFLFWALVYALVNARKPTEFPLKVSFRRARMNKAALIVFCLIFVLILAVLVRSVWFETQNGIVITGSNWQDTPYHYELVESLNNGNFPPQMPYFSGEKLTYQGDFFVDFHTAIVEKTFGFLPQLLPFINAVLIGVFGLCVYALARVHGKRAAVISSVVGTFGWGFSYFTLFSALDSGRFSYFTNYGYQYNGFYGLPPILDNLLQQRPLLLGLPVFALVLLLLRNMESKNRVLLAGIVTGLVFPFHIVSFFCAYIAFFFSLVLSSANLKRYYFYFLISALFAIPFLLEGAPSIPISLSPLWAWSFVKGNPLLYYFANLGIPFALALVSFAFPKRIKDNLLKVVLVIVFLIPNAVSMTPNPWDMYKFFIFLWVPIAVLSGALLASLGWGHFGRFVGKISRVTRKGIVILLIVLSLLSSLGVVAYNVGTNFVGASKDEYKVGVWVRDHTEQGSVFLTSASIHCPPIMIGGRVRVLAYLNWPYGHGIPSAEIYARLDDVDRAYNGTEEDLKQVVQKYLVSYVYVGSEELCNYPTCVQKFDSISWLSLVYDKVELVYRVNLI